jgi:hypothetical protein
MAEPVRDELLQCLTVDGASTADRLAARTGHPRDVVAGHLEVLEAAGAVRRLDAPGTDPAFETTVQLILSDAEWAQVPLHLRRQLFAGDLERIASRARAALAGGGFDRVDAHVSWTPLSLDEAGQAELAALLWETYERMMAIQQGSHARRPGEEPRADELRSEVAILQYQGRGLLPAPAPPTAPARERIYELVDDLGDAVADETADWAAIARSAQDLLDLAQGRVEP